MKQDAPPCHRGSSLTTHSLNPLRYRCLACGRTYTSRMRELSYGSKLNNKEVLLLLKTLRKGCSIRRTAKLLDISPSTAFRWKKRFLSEHLLSPPITFSNHENLFMQEW